MVAAALEVEHEGALAAHVVGRRDADRPTARHGTPPRLLVCEFAAVGYELIRFERLADTESYFAQFQAREARPEPEIQ